MLKCLRVFASFFHHQGYAGEKKEKGKKNPQPQP